MILPHRPYALVPQIYAASDLCLVPLALNTGSDAVPSKVYRIMACARPVMACADAKSDLGRARHAGAVRDRRSTRVAGDAGPGRHRCDPQSLCVRGDGPRGKGARDGSLLPSLNQRAIRGARS